MRSLVSAALLVVLATATAGSAQAPEPPRPATPAAAGDLIGTWTLSAAEHSISAQPSRIQNPRGVLVFDGAGHVFEIVTRAGRTGATGAVLSPAQQTFATYGGFWGGYSVDMAERKLTIRPEGAVSPNMMGRETTRTFTLDGDALTITSQPDEPHTQGGARWTWERVPVVDNLSPGYRQVIGFWQHVVERRVNLTTGQSTETRRAPSIIVYTPSGYVGVHFPPLNRQKFASADPTDSEAQAALKGFVGYFGALGVYPNMVFHQVLAGVSPVAGSTLKRPLEVKDSEVVIKFPPTTNQQGQQMRTEVVLKRLSGADAMLPPR